MRRAYLVVIVAGFVLILGAQAVYTLILCTPSGVRIRSPEGNVVLPLAFVVSGDAWARAGISRIRVEAVPMGNQDPGAVDFPATRDTVRDRGKVLFPLSSWSCRVELPAGGPWDIRAAVTGTDGSTFASAARRLSLRHGAPTREFSSWSPGHLIPIAVIFLGACALGMFVRGKNRGLPATDVSRRFFRTALWLTIVVWVNEFAYQVYWFLAGGWSVTGALMLQMCGLAILFLPVMLLSENARARQRWFDVLYFWGIGGAIQALIAPDIGANGFPAYRYFSFFLSHGLIITMTVLMAMAGGVKIGGKSLLRAFVVRSIKPYA